MGRMQELLQFTMRYLKRFLRQFNELISWIYWWSTPEISFLFHLKFVHNLSLCLHGKGFLVIDYKISCCFSSDKIVEYTCNIDWLFRCLISFYSYYLSAVFLSWLFLFISHLQCRKRQLKVSVVCVPKTIDNDILLMDKTFGFDTAVEEAQRAINSAYIEVPRFVYYYVTNLKL